MRSLAYATARPRYGFWDLVGLLLREILLMILVFLTVFALAAAAVFTLKKTYTAHASLFVGIGQEYVYQPRIGETQPFNLPQPGEVAQSELTILKSQALAQRVLRTVGVEAVLGEPGTEVQALRAFSNRLGVVMTPTSGILDLGYEDEDAERAARILNATIDQYLLYRREVFQNPAGALLRGQRQRFEQDLAEADSAYGSFLQTNDLGDFTAQKAALAATYQTVFAERLSVEAQLNQARQRVATLEAQQATTPAEVALQQDLNISAQDQILQLRTEREQLLARYQPGSQPVREIETRIAQLQAYVGTGTAVGAREVRLGPNPVWVELETNRINARADRDSLAARLVALDRQLVLIRQRQGELTRLESENATLASSREVLTASIRDFQQREARSRAETNLSAEGVDSITILARAAPPTRGKSLKAPLLALGFLFAGITAVCAGLIRVFSRSGLPTASSAERTLGLPVLAVAPVKG
ncbi:Wzz/FepE/Etk N-terminal domain-containing protein [Brevundimonas sp.]|uniref:GumC family protein n=1 Tax=Brevundimonas sp. TaxID=1871086 RepID=UPI0022C36A69|nr:Wzz/FepE/Etk N-terminal domain-containing protein [Brevundimonas sp.]MCZ8195209.1 Wzz/FepE/Etk N-terminal domain-containing protein [Brevundimonas sp.]